jgi:hypothetical protein
VRFGTQSQLARLVLHLEADLVLAKAGIEIVIAVLDKFYMTEAIKPQLFSILITVLKDMLKELVSRIKQALANGALYLRSDMDLSWKVLKEVHCNTIARRRQWQLRLQALTKQLELWLQRILLIERRTIGSAKTSRIPTYSEEDSFPSVQEVHLRNFYTCWQHSDIDRMCLGRVERPNAQPERELAGRCESCAATFQRARHDVTIEDNISCL